MKVNRLIWKSWQLKTSELFANWNNQITIAAAADGHTLPRSMLLSLSVPEFNGFFGHLRMSQYRPS